MKLLKTITVIGCLLIGGFLNAQVTFEVSTELPFTELIDDIPLNGDEVWNYDGSPGPSEAINYSIDLGFNLKVNEESFDRITVSGSSLRFSKTDDPEGTPFLGSITFFENIFFRMLQDKGVETTASPITYKISGEEGYRILVIQWKNAGFVFENGAPEDFIDFQVWFFENNDEIQLRHGDSQTYAGSDASSDQGVSFPGCATFYSFDACSNVFVLTGDKDAPGYSLENLCMPNYFWVNGIPEKGTTYIINPSEEVSKTNTFSRSQITIYPNPVINTLQIDGVENSNVEIMVYDITGQLLIKSDRVEGLNVSELNSGMYILRINDNTGILTEQKFIKK